ncbi:nuclear transport factor 2 family protein [Pseudomonas sp. FME51]|uniref:nuclear transport factor 2 family protein n=1 Tax=Pseudomonas sp. FME51 TaxID=2742609 RepID=UPI001866A625|nr:nuclear transport factor 2 family protein [Pseudomonas sp. FME51]
MNISANQRLVTEYLRHMERNDFAAALELAHGDANFWMPGLGNLSKGELLSFFQQVGPMIKSMVFTLHGITEQGERLAVEASGCGELANGKVYNNEYHFLFVVRDGKIALMKEYADTAPASVFLE